jgi:spore coat polysaccharide biosynthesis protein SpsF
VKIAAVVQARAGSSRLPGKVLREVAGKPLLLYLVERLRHAKRLAGVIVATSTEVADDPVVALCVAQGVDVHRGALDDVAARILDAAHQRRLEAIVRVSADSPLLDQALVDRAIALMDDDTDVVTNVAPRTFPHGQSVEVVTVEALRRAYPKMDASDREHVTPALYRGIFRVRSFTHDPNLSEVQLAVDTPADLARFEAILGRMTRPHWQYGLDDVLRRLDT